MQYFTFATKVLVLVVSFLHLADASRNLRDRRLESLLDGATASLDRFALLPSNSDWIFDFTTHQPYYNFAPGGVTNMNAATFPATIKNGLTLAVVNLGPCAMLPPHYHPRAVNYVVAMKGNTTTSMYLENGAHLIVENLIPGKATIFPQGSMHMMQNNECTPAQLVSALNSDDAGTTNIAAVLTAGFDPAWVNAAFGDQDIAGDESSAKVPPVGAGANWGSAECPRRCGLLKDGTQKSPWTKKHDCAESVRDSSG